MSDYEWETGKFIEGDEIRPRRPIEHILEFVSEHPIIFAAEAFLVGIAILKFVLDPLLAHEFERWVP